MRGQKELAVPQRQFRMAAKKVARTEQTEEARPQQQQPDMDRYLLQIDRQTKRSFKNSRSCAICGTRDQRPLRQTWRVSDCHSTPISNACAGSAFRIVGPGQTRQGCSVREVFNLAHLFDHRIKLLLSLSCHHSTGGVLGDGLRAQKISLSHIIGCPVFRLRRMRLSRPSHTIVCSYAW
jgi:hypothetical protein